MSRSAIFYIAHGFNCRPNSRAGSDAAASPGFDPSARLNGASIPCRYGDCHPPPCSTNNPVGRSVSCSHSVSGRSRMSCRAPRHRHNVVPAAILRPRHLCRQTSRTKSSRRRRHMGLARWDPRLRRQRRQFRRIRPKWQSGTARWADQQHQQWPDHRRRRQRQRYSNFRRKHQKPRRSWRKWG